MMTKDDLMAQGPLRLLGFHENRMRFNEVRNVTFNGEVMNEHAIVGEPHILGNCLLKRSNSFKSFNHHCI